MNDDVKIQEIGVNLPLHTIQAIRLIGALMESDFLFRFSESSKGILEYLRKYFPITYSIGIENSKVLQNISIDHKAPQCKIGRIERPLIYPVGVLELCRKKWQTKREYFYFFSGLMTNQRVNTVFSWLSTHSNKSSLGNYSALLFLKLLSREVWFNSIFFKKGLSRKFQTSMENETSLTIVLSTKGRTFPEKAWDDNYFDQMANAKFVLCPNGDFIWTYRFFEAIFCGAIPIIEDEADIYKGFIYYRLSDPVEKYKYSQDIIHHNFQLAKERLTILKEQLNEEIRCLLENVG